LFIALSDLSGLILRTGVLIVKRMARCGRGCHNYLPANAGRFERIERLTQLHSMEIQIWKLIKRIRNILQ
jgi:hypothetical protein